MEGEGLDTLGQEGDGLAVGGGDISAAYALVDEPLVVLTGSSYERELTGILPYVLQTLEVLSAVVGADRESVELPMLT